MGFEKDMVSMFISRYRQKGTDAEMVATDVCPTEGFGGVRRGKG